VRLVPVARQGKRKLGQWAGQVHLAEDFDAPMSDEDLDGS
jgi:hypothetical protein